MTKYLKKFLFWIFIVAMVILMFFLGMHAFIDGNGSRAVNYLVEKYELDINTLNVTEFQEYVYEDIVNCDSLWLRKCTSDENLAYIIVVETKDGEKYTRKGQFTLDKEGALVTSAGEYVLSENNAPIFIAPGEREITISESGDVISENGVIGRLKVAKFADNQKLLKVNGVLFENVEGNAVSFDSDNIRIAQGMLESSNVNAINEMTNLVKIQRSYDYVRHMIDEEHDRLSNTISTYAELA